MAGDWIKWVKGLTRRDEVVRIAMLLKRDRRYVASLCMEFWEWVDDSTVDGFLPGVTVEQVDIVVDSEGFGASLEAVGWIATTPKGITVSHFDRHNGNSAKSRALGALRQAKRRSDTGERDKCNGASVTPALQMSRSERDESVTREEKRREEKNSSSSSKKGQPESASVPASTTRRPPAAAAAVASLKAWAKEQAKRPDWLPQGKPWISESAWIKAATSCPQITAEQFAEIIREARHSRNTLANPAGYVLSQIRKLGGSG